MSIDFPIRCLECLKEQFESLAETFSPELIPESEKRITIQNSTQAVTIQSGNAICVKHFLEKWKAETNTKLDFKAG